MSAPLIPASGAFLQDDNNPLGPSTLSLSGSIADALIDLDLGTRAFYFIAPHKWSAGVDLGSSKFVDNLILYDKTNEAGIWGGADLNSLKVYKSDDNIIWTLVATFNPVNRIVHAGIIHKIACVFPAEVAGEARYWKLNAYLNGLSAVLGAWLDLTELEVYGLVPEAKQQTIVSDADIFKADNQQPILSDATVKVYDNRQIILSDAYIFPATSSDPFVFESVPTHTSFSLKTKDESKITLLDVKLKHICDHNLPSGKYTLNDCPRCLGKGYYFDMKFSPRGDVFTVSEIEKLLQELVKITLTSKGGNFFHEEYGSYVSDSIGMVQSKNFREARLKQSIIDAVLRLRYLQRDGIEKGYKFSLKELIDKISKIEIYEIENDPTQLGFKVTVQTVEGMTAILQGSVTL